MSLRHNNRVDGNQAAIVKLIRQLGAVWIPCVPPFGADGLVLWRKTVFIVEIKDSAQPPSKRRLTENEQKLKNLVTSAGCSYLVWESEADALDSLTGYRP